MDQAQWHQIDLRFAMTTPWSVELNQNIFVIVKDNIVVVLRDNNGHWSFLLLWDRLRLDTGLDLAINIILDKLAHVLFGDFGSAEWELLVFDSVLNGEGRPLAHLKVQVSGVCAKCFGINCRKVNFALEFLRQ
jgi:hypothetical protein